jgi:hypothetical protein
MSPMEPGDERVCCICRYPFLDVYSDVPGWPHHVHIVSGAKLGGRIWHPVAWRRLEVFSFQLIVPKLDSECPGCGNRIRKGGDQVAWKRGHAAMHPDCALEFVGVPELLIQAQIARRKLQRISSK